MALPAQFAALATPAYRNYWLGSTASVGGLQLLTIAQGWLVYELTRSPLYLGLLGVASSVPNLVLGFFGGAIADRLDKREVLRATALLNALLMFVLAALDASGVITVVHVLIIAVLQSIVTGLDWPTRSAVYPMLIAREHMMSAVALNSIVWQGTRMVMPALGGLLLAATDTWVLFALAGLGMLVMAWVVHRLAIHAPGTRTATALDHTLEGLRFIRDNRLFLVLLLLAYVTMFFGTSYVTLMPAFSALLGAGSDGYGLLLSATGVGSVLGTVVSGFAQREERVGRIMLLCAGAFAPCIIAFAVVALFADRLPGAFLLALPFAMAASLFSSVFNILSMTIMQLRVPDALRGRVMGIHGISFSCMSLGAIFTGSMATAIGTPSATIISASIVLLVVAWVALTQAIVREHLEPRHAH
jgi:MFS family permease